jgi:hypothetical protein
MSKTDFQANDKAYIASIAAFTGCVVFENVKILRIDEISTRSSRHTAGQLRMAVSVRVQTLVLIAIEQLPNIHDEYLLNSNLNRYGLPSGRLIVERNNLVTETPAAAASSVFVVNTTPAPKPGCSDGEHTLSLPPLCTWVVGGWLVGWVDGWASMSLAVCLSSPHSLKLLV